MKRYSKRRKASSKIWIYAGLLALSGSGLAYVGFQMSRQILPDEYGCFSEFKQPQTIVMVDASEPRFNEEQARSLRRYFDQRYQNLGFNERLSFITSESDQLASVVSPRFHVCGQATSSAQLEAAGAPVGQSGYLKKQKQKLYEEIVAPELDQLLSSDPDENRRQRYQSPIMEMIGDTSRMPNVRPGTRLIVVSDMIQNSDSAQFCRVKNEMPSFRVFKTRPVYSRIKPKSLEDVQVEILMIQRIGCGRKGLNFCSGEDELMAFWRDYFTDNGAEVHFIRIRHGYVQGD